MKVAKILVAVFLLALSTTPYRASADDTAKQNDIVHLLKITGTLQIADQMAASIVQQFAQMMKQSDPETPDAAIKAVEEETIAFMREQIPGLMTKVTPIYGQHFSHEEIKQLIDFYDTEIGRKAISVMPQMTQQIMMISQQHFQQQIPQLQQRIAQRLQAEGFE